MARPGRGPVFQVFSMPILDPPQGQYPGSDLRVAPEEYRWVQQGNTPHEGGARGLDPSECQPPIREAVLGHRRDVTLRYGWIWGLGSWTLCLSPADWVQYAQGAMD